MSYEAMTVLLLFGIFLIRLIKLVIVIVKNMKKITGPLLLGTSPVIFLQKINLEQVRRLYSGVRCINTGEGV